MNAPKRIPEDEFYLRLDTLMQVLIPVEIANPVQTTELFNLHNDIFWPKETGRSCGKCRTRVFNRMKNHYLTWKKKS